ncbi:hypothetical protein D0U02_24320 [Burkholderia pseudomallei]|uniref:Uncharacterized protein n=2 Tax=Burkholderia pseudomallei TaxID=28450 RepID=A0A0H3HX00_BURP2|nr:hypothetical protein BP1026B_II2172 [Burkholderia pseudomallei 1026b]ARK45482.1 hypothetical protein BOC35_03165 [Burkholderia pseudomallei]EIF55265.1 hypothetical protein BP1258B_5321 [Burkholderia pseudomallei 1258b]EIF55883.1 hypothetical protein BP1258A_4644 [Burkholderia pseudomallei 1258a]EIF57409.1 hypothetical protein BP1026A_3861 [Burkholderia pseudomallei 1026a]EIF71758.1 hypothetical protein BP354E_4598 [Burkholderia pseudomallei 354e]EIF74353.1 hypothetical protein BP354A_5392 
MRRASLPPRMAAAAGRAAFSVARPDRFEPRRLSHRAAARHCAAVRFARLSFARRASMFIPSTNAENAIAA